MSDNSPENRRAIAWRISVYFAALFVVPGIHLPFFSVWLQSRGLSPTEISVILASGILLRLVAGPMAAHAVDRNGRRRQAIIVLTWLSLAFYTLLGWTEGFWPMLGIWLLHTAAWGPIAPFSENIAVLASTRHNLQYGRLRLWGSLSFLVTAYLAGLWLKGRDDNWIFILLLIGMLGLALGSHLLPDLRLPLNRPRIAGAPAMRLMRSPLFLAFLGANACLQASHAMFYTFGTLHWRSQGLSDAQIGFLWAEGVLAEVILFAVGQRVAQHVGGVGLLALAALGGAIRWSFTAFTGDFSVLVALNLLHAATFGCAHLGAMRLLAGGVDPDASASAQSLYSAANSALLAAGTLAVGPLFAAFGGLAYLAMLPLSLGGGLCVLLLWRQRSGLQFVTPAA
ncbi:MFS transporter [Ferrovibrio terrae]|uniref:MFS transporter n=1 Tax=Ferrovibrio terrae TaxID=2594003 RepID=UPI003137FFC5